MYTVIYKDEVVCSIQQQHSKLYTVDTIYFSDLFYISMHWTNQYPLKELHPLLVSYGQRVDSASFCQAYFGFFFSVKGVHHVGFVIAGECRN